MEGKWTLQEAQRQDKAKQSERESYIIFWLGCSFVLGGLLVWAFKGPLSAIPPMTLAVIFVLAAIFNRIDGFIKYGRRAE